MAGKKGKSVAAAKSKQAVRKSPRDLTKSKKVIAASVKATEEPEKIKEKVVTSKQKVVEPEPQSQPHGKADNWSTEERDALISYVIKHWRMLFSSHDEKAKAEVSKQKLWDSITQVINA